MGAGLDVAVSPVVLIRDVTVCPIFDIMGVDSSTAIHYLDSIW